MENGNFTDKFILNTKLERKPTDLDHKACVIEKAIPVDHEKFLSLKNAPYLDERLIAQNKDCMYYDSGDEAYHCLLIYDKDQGDGIVIESEGSDYARYAQLVPQAKVIYENYRNTHLNELRLCCPIELYQHIDNYPKDNCILDNGNMAKYVDKINIFIHENDIPAEYEQGLMHWYSPECPDDEIVDKVYSAHCSVDVINGELTGVITVRIIGQLSDEAMEKFKQFCVGQLSDGWGESLEQKYMRTDNGEINVCFWSDDDYWDLLPEQEYLESIQDQSEGMCLDSLAAC